MSKDIYIVNKLKEIANINIPVVNQEIELHFSGMADGCIGVMLVFESKEDALKLAKSEDYITEASIPSK